MENLDKKLEQLKQDNPIMKVASELGFVFNERSTTVAVKCYNHEDRTPSLVLQPETNSFECKSCGEKGDALTLIQKIKGCEFKEAVLFLDPHFYPEKKDEKPRDIDKDDYWNSRGISEATRIKFRLTVKKDGVYIPLSNGSIKRRNFKPYFDKHINKWKFPKFHFVESKGKCLFKAGQKSDFIFLTEGELDAVKLLQETGHTVISDTTGAASFDPIHINDPYIKDAKKIYIIPDNDEAGLKGALKTAQILGLHRCYQISLPQGKDITEYFVKYKHTGEQFKTLIDNAVSMQLLHTEKVTEYTDNALDFSSMTEEEILHIEKHDLLSFGLPKMDTGERVVGITPGFIIFAAPQGIGKSWMMLHLTRKFFEKHKKKSVIISLEMTKNDLKERALQAYSELTQEQFKRGADVKKGLHFLTKECQPIIQEFVLDDGSKVTSDELSNIIDYRYSQGYRVFHFDHFHQISGMSDGNTASKVAEDWSRAIKNLVDKYRDIWFIAYAQTNKVAANRPVKKEDIRYCSPFIDKCDMVFSINNPAAWIEARKGANQNLEELYNPPTNRQILILLSKSRKLTVNARAWLIYHSETGNFIQDKELYNDVQDDKNLQFTRKSTTFAPTPDFSKPPVETSKTDDEIEWEEVEETKL